MNHRFETFRSWRIVGWCRFKQLAEALWAILYVWIVWGILSLFIYIGRQIGAFFRRETIAGCIIVAIIASMGIGWLTTFVKERDRAVTAQHRADSLAYDLSKFTQMYDTTDIIVINGDTIKSW